MVLCERSDFQLQEVYVLGKVQEREAERLKSYRRVGNTDR